MYRITTNLVVHDGGQFNEGELFSFSPQLHPEHGGVYISIVDQAQISKDFADKYQREAKKPLFVKV